MKSIKIKAQPANGGGRVVGGTASPVTTTAGIAMPAGPATAAPAGPASTAVEGR